MHSCTTSSGALAPAVISTVSTPSEPLVPDLRDAVDQVSRPAQPVGDLRQPPAVRAVLAAEHQHQVRLRGQLAHRLLPVLGRVADVILGWIGDLGNFFRRAAMTMLASSTLRVVWVR